MATLSLKKSKPVDKMADPIKPTKTVPPLPKAKPEKKIKQETVKRSLKKRKLCLKWLLKDFPVFSQYKPLKVGIIKDVLERERPEEFSRTNIRQALGHHAGNLKYLKNLRTGPRFDLEGQPCGKVTLEQADIARLKCKRRKELNPQDKALA